MKSESSTYTGFEFEVDGYPAMAIINTDLKNMDDRFDYDCSVFVSIIPDAVNENGHPTEPEYEYLNEVEKEMIAYLENQTATVHVGHTTVFRGREIIFYTKDKVMVEIFLENFLPGIEREFSFELEQDPEWGNVEGFYELI